MRLRMMSWLLMLSQRFWSDWLTRGKRARLRQTFLSRSWERCTGRSAWRKIRPYGYGSKFLTPHIYTGLTNNIISEPDITFFSFPLSLYYESIVCPCLETIHSIDKHFYTYTVLDRNTKNENCSPRQEKLARTLIEKCNRNKSVTVGEEPPSKDGSWKAFGTLRPRDETEKDTPEPDPMVYWHVRGILTV